MIKLIQSKRIQLPIVYLIENDEDLKELPFGIPFMRGAMSNYRKFVQVLEWDVLWKAAQESGLPFNWHKILKKHKFKTWTDAKAYTPFIKKESSLSKEEIEAIKAEGTPDGSVKTSTDELLNDASYKVNIELLQDLNLIPSWYSDVEKAISENVTNSIVYNPTLYTKKLDMPLGDFEYGKIEKNVIIIDISGSIPSSVSSTTLVLAKTLSEKFYADLVITGSKTTLYEYNIIDTLDIDSIYTENGTDNDQAWFKKVVSEPRNYKSAIVFGDNHHPGQRWRNTFNKKTKYISDEQGKEICKWKVKEILSFHTHSVDYIAGYARWFDTKKVRKIEGWVKDIK